MNYEVEAITKHVFRFKEEGNKVCTIDYQKLVGFDVSLDGILLMGSGIDVGSRKGLVDFIETHYCDYMMNLEQSRKVKVNL